MQSVFLFQDMSPAQRYLVAPYLDERCFQPGETLVEAGEPGDEFFVILEGTVRISRGDLVLVDIGPGEHLGELSLMQSAVRSATATAVDSVRVYALSRARFAEIRDRRPELGNQLLMSLLHTVGDRLKELTGRLSDLESVVQGLELSGHHTQTLLDAVRGRSGG